MRKNPRRLYVDTFNDLKSYEVEREELRPVLTEQAKHVTHDIIERNWPSTMRRNKKNREQVRNSLAGEISAKIAELPGFVRYHELEKLIPEMRERLFVLTKSVKPDPGVLRVVIKRVDETAYHTVGLGAKNYARGAIEVHQEMLKHAYPDIKTERTTELRTMPTVGKPYEMFVLVGYVAEEIDADIITRAGAFHHDDALRNYLKACWSRALNPRVFNPLLPQGLEERLKIDYQGRDKP